MLFATMTAGLMLARTGRPGVVVDSLPLVVPDRSRFGTATRLLLGHGGDDRLGIGGR